MTDELSHDQFVGWSALYALGGLDVTECDRFEQHLEVCRLCVDEVTSFLPVVHGLLQLAPAVEPPDRLRKRLFGGPITPDPPAPAPVLMSTVSEEEHTMSGTVRWTAIAGVVMALGLGWYGWQQTSQSRALQARLEATTLQREVADLDAATSRRSIQTLRGHAGVLAAPDLIAIPLEGQPEARQASGRAFLSESRGIVVLASEMPALASDEAYQIWLVTRPNPVSAGLAVIDADGHLFESIPPVVDLSDLVAVAVTRESEGGADQPSDAVVLLGRVD